MTPAIQRRNTHPPREVEPVSFDTPPHIRRLQAAIRANDIHHSEAVGEEKRALYAARWTWRQASLLPYAELQAWLRDMPLFFLHEEPASQLLWGVR